MSDRWVELDREISVSGNTRRLRVSVASTSHNMDPKLFLYLALPPNPDTDVQIAEPQGVCSPTDLVDYPADTPAPNASPAWFRHHVVDYLLPSAVEMEDAWNQILKEVTALIDALNALDNLQPSGTFYVGSVPSSESV